MKVAVIGLGMEGKNASYSLLKRGHQVYASDMNEDLKIDYVKEFDEDLELELGGHNWDKINSADAVVLSPSLWNNNNFKKLKSKKKFLSDLLNHHKSILTIGVTGTNGKTTTSLMIKEIMDKQGLKVLIGGNAGGGFEGYTEIMLQAAETDYDILIVEVCDMTLDFCSDNFDFDVVVVTNLGLDHLDVHRSLQNYQKSVEKFIKGKTAVLNSNDKLLSTMEDYSKYTLFFDHYKGDMKLFGSFNRQNAAAAAEVAKILDIPEEDIKESLQTFAGVAGRIKELKLGQAHIVIGKTDNVHAAAAILNEKEFEVVIMGTPRRNEYWRYKIYQEISNVKPQYVALFPGLEDTTGEAKNMLREYGYDGPIQILSNIPEVVELTLQCSKRYSHIFIGGNGQKKLMKIKEILKQIEQEGIVS